VSTYFRGQKRGLALMLGALYKKDLDVFLKKPQKVDERLEFFYFKLKH
jgi:hypothetical protein